MATWDMFWEKAGKGFAEAHSKADDRRARKKELKEERDIRAKELAAALKERQEAAREARHARTDERNWLLLQKDADRAYDELKKQDEARRKVAGFDPKIREQVGQAPSLIRSDAPSLPYGKDELGYDHPFKGSPELIEDVTRSLKEEEGEVDWLAAAARGARIQTMADKAKEDARVNQEARERAVFSESLSTLGERFRLDGRDGKEFTPVDEKIMPLFLQKANHLHGSTTESLSEKGRDREFLASVRKDLLTASQGLSSWGHKHVNPKTVAEASDAYASITIAEAKKNLFDTQQKVFGSPPNLTPMDKPEIVNLPIGEVNSLTRKWSEALEDQRIKRIGAEAKAKHEATQKPHPKPYYTMTKVTQDFADPKFIPDFTEYRKEMAKLGVSAEVTQEMINEKKDEIAEYGEDIVFDAPPAGWQKDAEKERKRVADEPKRVMELDRQAWRSLNAKAAAGEDMSESDRKYLGQLNEMFGMEGDKPSVREMSLSDISNPRERERIMAIPEDKPFKDSTGASWIRRGDKLLRVK